jgi:hypothetical protein
MAGLVLALTTAGGMASARIAHARIAPAIAAPATSAPATSAPATSAPATATRAEATPMTTGARTARRGAPHRSVTPPVSVRVAPAYRITVRRGEAVSLEIPIPVALQGRDSVAFLVNRSLPGVAWGAGSGTFMSPSATVSMTVRVPADFAAGTHRLADVRFRSADGRGERVIVPVELTVPEADDADGADTRHLATAMEAPLESGNDDPPMATVRRAVPRATSARNAFTAAPPAGPVRAVRVAAAVTVVAAPRTLQVVSVSAPADLPGALSFTVDRTADVSGTGVPGTGASVAGPVTGRVASATGQVMLTVSVPSRALAGTQRVAAVRFESDAADAPVVVVPVQVEVPAVRALSVASASPMVHAVAGRTTSLRIVVSNAGNVHDTVLLAVAPPEQWRGELTESPRVGLAPGASVSREITLTAPREQVPGVTSLALHAVRGGPRAGDEADARQRQLVVPVEVLPATRGQSFGPVLGVSYSAVYVGDQAPVDAIGFTLSGPLARGVVMHGAWTQRAIGGSPGIARVGGGQLFPVLSLRHPRWQLDAGNAAADLGEVGGTLRSGRGLSGAYGDSAWQVQALLARPFLFGSESLDAGALAGVRLRARRGPIAWSAGAAHLRDPLLLRAQLDAVSVGAERVALGGIDARGELAWRQWEDGSALGAAAEFGRRADRVDWRLRATYAPGGSRAFARAQSDVTFTGGLAPSAARLGGMRLGFVGWYADDETADGSLQSTWGVGLMPQWRLGRLGSLGFEARTGASEAGGDVGRQSTATHILGLFASTRLGITMATTGATITRLDRTLMIPDLERAESSEQQLNWTAQLLVPLARGTFDVFSSLQRRYGADVFSTGQHDLTLRADQIALPMTGGRVTFGAAIGRITSLASGAHVTTQRVGLAAALPFDVQLRLDLERNPWIRSAATDRGAGWVTAFRFDRSFGTPPLLRFGRGRGVVFEDRNGNGVRDRGERGLGGILVRVGAEVAVTDATGTYRVTRPGAGIPELDERSLPFGYMLAPQVVRATHSALRDGATDIPVAPIGAVEVILEVAADSLRDARPIPLDAVLVSAVDARGRRFLAAAVTGGRTVFTALPPGEYHLEVDAAGVSEPLALVGAPPVVRIDGTAARQQVRVTLGPRRVRLFRAEPATRQRTGER